MKNVSVSEETHARLVKLAAIYTQLYGTRTTLGETIERLTTDELDRLRDDN